NTPLLAGVAIEKGLVQLIPEQASTLLLKVGRRVGIFAADFSEEFLGLLRSEVSPEKLLHCGQSNGKGGSSVTCNCSNRVDIRHESREARNESPDLRIVAVHDMGAVCMDHYPRRCITVGMAVPTRMAFLFHYVYAETILCKYSCHRCARQARAYN